MSSDEGRAWKRKVAAALAYEPHRAKAPRLVAKGHGVVADEILAVASASGVPIEDNPAMADALVKLDLLQEIPVELYEAIAEMIAFIHRLSSDDTASA